MLIMMNIFCTSILFKCAHGYLKINNSIMRKFLITYVQLAVYSKVYLRNDDSACGAEAGQRSKAFSYHETEASVFK